MPFPTSSKPTRTIQKPRPFAATEIPKAKQREEQADRRRLDKLRRTTRGPSDHMPSHSIGKAAVSCSVPPSTQSCDGVEAGPQQRCSPLHSCDSGVESDTAMQVSLLVGQMATSQIELDDARDLADVKEMVQLRQQLAKQTARAEAAEREVLALRHRAAELQADVQSHAATIALLLANEVETNAQIKQLQRDVRVARKARGILGSAYKSLFDDAVKVAIQREQAGTKGLITSFFSVVENGGSNATRLDNAATEAYQLLKKKLQEGFAEADSDFESSGRIKRAADAVIETLASFASDPVHQVYVCVLAGLPL